jgi:ketosteroid isomerase-like protein
MALRTSGRHPILRPWRERWSSVRADDGTAVEMTGNSKVVVRRQSDGTWKLVIDDPGWTAA